MARFRTSRMKVLLGLAVVAVLVAAFGVTQLALAAAGGNNGTVKIHEGAGEPSPVTKDETHVCTFHVHALFLDAGQTLTFEITSWPPTGDRSVVLSGTIQTDASGAGRAPATGAYSLDEGHYRLTVDTGNGRPTEDKHKEFWVKCAAATTTTAGETTTTAGETTTTVGETTTTAGQTTTSGATSTSGETSTTVGETTTTAGQTTTSGATSTSGETSTTVGETTTTAGETTTTAGETTTTVGETTTTKQEETTTTAGQTTTSGATSTSGETSTTVGETTTTAGETTTSVGETTSSSAPSSLVGGASSSAPSSSLGLGAVAAKRLGLPRTGANALPLLVAGLLLFGIGAATVRAARRR
jgi:hypothetical protein